MAVWVKVDGHPQRFLSYSVTESSTPTAGNDTSGGIGTMSVTVGKPDLNLEGPYSPFRQFGSQLLIDAPVELYDSERGAISGRVVSLSDNPDGTVALSCLTDNRNLNALQVSTGPFIGTLGAAFQRYASLAGSGVTTDVHPSLAGRSVRYPGFQGELWFHLKMLAMAENCEVSLVSGVLTLRPLRSNIIPDTGSALLGDRNLQVSSTLAQAVKVTQYNNREIVDELVYPVGGWDMQVSPIVVNAGASIEEPLEISASLTSVQQPQMVEFVSPGHRSSSVFTAVGDDGLPVKPAMWRAYGGKLTVDISEDTKSLILHVTAPVGLPSKDGVAISQFGLSLASSNGTGRYSTLRVVGSGVAYDPQEWTIPTGVTAAQTGSEVGASIENPFITNKTQAYRIGVRAAKQFSGATLTLSNSALIPGESFGDIGGSRFYDRESARWFRIRESSVTEGPVSNGAMDDDLLWGDFLSKSQGKTYRELVDFYSAHNASYRKMKLIGLNIE